MSLLIKNETKSQLLQMARAAAESAYCPYSNFRVGAAVLAGGRIFTGCNVENASAGLTICAERSAIFRAVTAGETQLDLLAVSCPDVLTKSATNFRMPCGGCRQVICEFGHSATIILVDAVGEFSLNDLLPQAFILGSRRRPISSAADAHKPRLCIDIDNVICDSDRLMRQIISEVTSGRVNFRYQDIIEFDYRNCLDALGANLRLGDPSSGAGDEWKVIHDVFSERVIEIAPYPGVQAVLGALADVFELHFVTSRLYRARRGTIEWLQEHQFPECIRLHFLTSGEKHKSAGGFFASVEDDLRQALAFAHSGIHSFVRMHPWNSNGECELVHRYHCWEEIHDALLELVGAK